MVLYHSISLFQLLEVIIHRHKYHDSDKAVLILPDFITEKFPQYEKLTEEGLFDEVYLFPYLHIPHIKRTVERATLKAYDELIPYPINSFERIYIAGCHFYFSLVPIKRRVDFTVFEDSPGMIHNTGFLLGPLEKQFPVHAEKVRRYGLMDFSAKRIQNIIVNSTEPDVKKPQTLFSVRHELENCSEKFIDSVIDIFGTEKINIPDNTVLLLTEQFANLGMMSTDEQLRMYKFICKEYIKDRALIIKPHPDDKINYENEIENCRVIRQIFPAELMPYILSQPPGCMLTVGSTAVLGFEGVCKTTVLSEDPGFISEMKSLGVPTEHLIRHIG